MKRRIKNFLRSNILFFYISFFIIILFGTMPILKVFNLNTAILDLGVYNRLFWNLSSEFKFQMLFYGHAQPFLGAMVLFFKLWQSSFTLVCLQSFLLSLTFLSLFFLFSKNRHPNCLPILAFLLYFPLWYNLLFDFHIDHLVVPLLFLFYFSCQSMKWKIAVFSAVNLLFIKEVFALVTVFCGVYLILRYKKYKLGICVGLIGIIYFYVITAFIIPRFSFDIRSGLDSSAYLWLGKSPLEMIYFILTHPILLFKEIFFNFEKVKYILILFAALAFIPCFAWIELIPAIPLLAISLLSRVDNYYGIGHHYTVGLIVPMIMAFNAGFPKSQYLFSKATLRYLKSEKVGRAFPYFIVVSMLFIHILISPSPLSRLFWSNKVWNYGYEAYIPSKRNTIIKKRLKEYIPANVDVVVSSQNTLNYAHLAHRKYYFSFPVGVTSPVVIHDSDFMRSEEEIYADYISLDIKRPWFLNDDGCGWRGKEPLSLSDNEIREIGISENPGPLKWASCSTPEFRRRFINTILEARKLYKIIYEWDGFLIMKKNGQGSNLLLD